jgi:hypothetical protein
MHMYDQQPESSHCEWPDVFISADRRHITYPAGFLISEKLGFTNWQEVSLEESRCCSDLGHCTQRCNANRMGETRSPALRQNIANAVPLFNPLGVVDRDKDAEQAGDGQQ